MRITKKLVLIAMPAVLAAASTSAIAVSAKAPSHQAAAAATSTLSRPMAAANPATAAEPAETPDTGTAAEPVGAAAADPAGGLDSNVDQQGDFQGEY